ncbi:hypothetical protein HPP92_011488 [Vanilla planifolia]|uniref:C3H1-type domain-containing protein n=1 Tax=Vanilla planifolia TaxID=51239 RepID=A0A835V245_VANPL|nr:hypothetical protein HPP92_011783 [Vanilla planifolia]KAG0483404.1 hypothetical protein HPP92_011488 [Vanilla planifolia]
MEFERGGGILLHAPMVAAVGASESPPSSSLVPILDEESMWQMSFKAAEIDPGPYPERPGEADCAYYLRTGVCRFGITCKFNHPSNRKLAVARMKGGHPERVGQPECQYYLKTGTCKFGPTCKFHHPKDKAGITGRVELNTLGYPLRLNEKECAYYLRTGQCKFGNTCKFHHPQPSNAMLSLRGSSVYQSLHSATTPGQQSFTGGLTSWSLPKASFIASPRWQGPSSYAQLVLPQGLVQVSNWNAFPGRLGTASSPERLQQNSRNPHFYGPSRQSETNTVSSISMSSVGFGSVPIGPCAFQRDNIFPERPGEPECQFYMKTGDCKFGAACKFHHPTERTIAAANCMLSPLGLPLRPGEPPCVFYSRYGICKFGPNCKFDHPMAAPMGIFAYSLSTSSPDLPVVHRLMGSSSGPTALSFSVEGSPDVGPGKSSGLSSSDSQQMNSSDENDESE